MKQRLISAFFAIILLELVLMANKIVFDAAVVIIATMAIYEVNCALGVKDCKIMMRISLLMPLALMLATYFAPQHLLFVIFLFMGAFLLVMLFDHNVYTFSKVAVFFTGSVLVSLTFIYVSLTRRMDNGLLNVFVIFIGSWITDTCAYFCGMFFGKHKLAPKISPKKTVEGSVGGILGVTVILAAYAYVFGNILDNVSANVFAAALAGLLCGIISQCGDLCASIIKRENNIKDFGNIMPGHGGVMDRFDSFIFVAPVMYCLLSEFPIFI